MSPAYWRGRSAVAHGDYRQAERDFLLALEADPENPLAMIWLLYARSRMRRQFRSLGGMRRALQLAPNNPEILMVAARIHMLSARWASAMTHLRSALSIDPDSSELHAFVALIHLAKRKRAESEAAIEEALRLDPHDVVALDVKARFDRIYYDPAKAAQSAKTMLRNEPESHKSHMRAGEVCLANGDVPQAYWHYREALRLSPNSDEAREALLTALAHRFPLYNWLYRLSNRLRRYRFAYGFTVCYILFRVAAWISTSVDVPAWVRTAMVCLLAAVGIVLLLLLLPMPVVMLAIRFHPVGRHALTKSDKFETGFIAVLLPVVIVALPYGLIWHADGGFLLAAICGIPLLLTTLCTFSLRRSSIRVIVLAFAILFWLVGLTIFVFALLPSNSDSQEPQLPSPHRTHVK